MRRNFGLVIIVLSLMMVFSVGCTKKDVLKEDRMGAKESATVAADTKPAAKAAPTGKAAKKGFSVGEPMLDGAEKKAPTEASVTKKAGKAADAAVSAKEIYELADINFEFDKFNLKDEARAILKKHAEWLNQNKDVMIVVEGHSDERGTAEYNLALGERRANAAAKFLVDMGIDEKRIKTLSYGEELPLDAGHSEDAWARNRRAHFAASGKK
ncbi:MAG: peptidoglycan-associated lipoprotein Pal [Syntrophales bacterium]|nr:peptidoglycan-associated lipoprotein Pal [Syntrophales bacterium]